MKKLFLLLAILETGLQAFSQELGDRFEGGIVFFLNPVKNYGLIVSAKDLAKDVEWGKNGEYGASNMDDGRENVKLLKKDKNSMCLPLTSAILQSLAAMTTGIFPPSMNWKKFTSSATSSALSP